MATSNARGIDPQLLRLLSTFGDKLVEVLDEGDIDDGFRTCSARWRGT